MSDDNKARDTSAAFCEYVNAMQQQGALADVPEDVLRDVMTAAVRAYAARVEKTEHEFAPVDARLVTATEAVTAACAVIRAVDLNMFDVTLWFNRSDYSR